MTPQDMQAKIGETIGTSEWLLVDQAMIDKFADATGDHQFIHVNPDDGEDDAVRRDDRAWLPHAFADPGADREVAISNGPPGSRWR